MAEVVQFPDRGPWAAFVELLTDMGIGNDYDPEDVEIVLAQLKPLFLEAWQQPAVSRDADLDASIERLNEWAFHYALTLLAIAARAMLQLRKVTSAPK